MVRIIELCAGHGRCFMERAIIYVVSFAATLTISLAQRWL